MANYNRLVLHWITPFFVLYFMVDCVVYIIRTLWIIVIIMVPFCFVAVAAATCSTIICRPYVKWSGKIFKCFHVQIEKHNFWCEFIRIFPCEFPHTWDHFNVTTIGRHDNMQNVGKNLQFYYYIILISAIKRFLT